MLSLYFVSHAFALGPNDSVMSHKGQKFLRSWSLSSNEETNGKQTMPGGVKN